MLGQTLEGLEEKGSKAAGPDNTVKEGKQLIP